MMNFSAYKVVLAANTIVGLINPVDDIYNKGDDSYGVQHVMCQDEALPERLYELWKENSENLDGTQGQQLRELLGKQLNVFHYLMMIWVGQTF